MCGVCGVYVCGMISQLSFDPFYFSYTPITLTHRDLKPDNMLITVDGHIKLTDFGLSYIGASVMNEMPSEFSHVPSEHRIVGTPDYLSPEVLMGIGFGPSVDWWALGIVTFEFLVGFPPFNDESPQQIFQNILKREIGWPLPPDELSPVAKDFIDRLLHPNPHRRLGANGAGEVKAHPFFEGVDWENLLETKLMFLPEPDSETDTGYFVPHSTLSMSLVANFQRSADAATLERQGEALQSAEFNESPSTQSEYLPNFTYINFDGLSDLTRGEGKKGSQRK